MFDNVTPEMAQRVVTGVKGHLSHAEIDRVLKMPAQTARHTSLFGFHPTAPTHVRDLAYEVELVRQSRQATVEKLEQLPTPEPPTGTLGLQRPAKKITSTNVNLVVDAIESGAQLGRINAALAMNPNGIHCIAKEGKHPNASDVAKRISRAIEARDNKKATTRQLLSAVATA